MLVSFVINFIKLIQHSSIMEISRSVETEVEVDPYEEIISLGDLNYSTPVTLVRKSVSPIRYEEDKLPVATFQ